AEIDDALRTNIVIQLAMIVVVGGLGLLIAGRILRPLTSLAATASTISDTDLDRRIAVTGRDEASRIAIAFNDMLDRLERAFTNQRQFLHDTSHELRTPLTVIRGHVELLDDSATPADRRATVDLVTDEIVRMTRLVDDLFLLALAELPDFVQPAPLDLRDVALDAHRKACVLAAREWIVDAPEPVIVSGDADRLSQAVLQLTANAVAHTHGGDRIVVGVDRRDGCAVLWVEDSGSGVAPDVAERIMERFARDGGSRGSGLGLHIVRTISQAHGGCLQLVPSSTSGARFEIVLPLAEDADGRTDEATPGGATSRR
ncbi:MAG: sensor histidine kinase, partial [Ilumatobacteraceae bacterium]